MEIFGCSELDDQRQSVLEVASEWLTSTVTSPSASQSPDCQFNCLRVVYLVDLNSAERRCHVMLLLNVIDPARVDVGLNMPTGLRQIWSDRQARVQIA